MKKKNTARDNVNLFFSAFLIVAYIVCGFFFISFAETLAGDALKASITAAVLAIFGLLVFYATRVGEGKSVKRFSIVTLVLLVLPTLFIVLAGIIGSFPFHAELVKTPVVGYMAAIAFGYALPYTFLSGFENVSEEPVQTEEKTVLKGGLEEELSEDSSPEEPTYEPVVDEIVVEGTNIIEDFENDE